MPSKRERIRNKRNKRKKESESSSSSDEEESTGGLYNTIMNNKKKIALGVAIGVSLMVGEEGDILPDIPDIPGIEEPVDHEVNEDGYNTNDHHAEVKDNVDFNAFMYFGGDHWGWCDMIEQDGTWKELVDTWEYDDIHPLHIDVRATASSDFGIPSEMSGQGIPHFILKYDGEYHKIVTDRTPQGWRNAIDDIIG